jgi:hypothetical protein
MRFCSGSRVRLLPTIKRLSSLVESPFPTRNHPSHRQKREAAWYGVADPGDVLLLIGHYIGFSPGAIVKRKHIAVAGGIASVERSDGRNLNPLISRRLVVPTRMLARS